MFHLQHVFYIFKVFLRLYLIGRLILFHSTITRSRASQSVGALNRVKITINFVAKHYLDRAPFRCLMVVGTLIFFIGSWSFRACDFHPGMDQISFSDSMWFFMVTFTTVGKCQ